MVNGDAGSVRWVGSRRVGAAGVEAGKNRLQWDPEALFMPRSDGNHGPLEVI